MAGMFKPAIDSSTCFVPPTPRVEQPRSSPSAFVAVVPSNTSNQAAPTAHPSTPGCTATGSAYVSENTLRAISQNFGVSELICHVMKKLENSGVSFHHPCVAPLLRDTLQALGEDQRFAAHIASNANADDTTGYAQAIETQAHACLASLKVLCLVVHGCSHDFPGRSAFLDVSMSYLHAMAQIPSVITLPAAAHGWMNWQFSAVATARLADLNKEPIGYPRLWADFALESGGIAAREVRKSLWRLAIEGAVTATGGTPASMDYDGVLVRFLRAGGDAEMAISGFLISDPTWAQGVRDAAARFAATTTIEQALDPLRLLCQPPEHAQQPPARNARLTLPP